MTPTGPILHLRSKMAVVVIVCRNGMPLLAGKENGILHSLSILAHNGSILN